MGFIKRELERIHDALRNERTNPKFSELYAAQQALAWALEPSGIRSPFDSIMGIQEAKEDCLGYLHPVPFSDIRSPEHSSQ